LEDASHAIGAHYQCQPVANCRYSTISVFGFHPLKIIIIAKVDLATINYAPLAQRTVDFRNHGTTKDAQLFELLAPGP